MTNLNCEDVCVAGMAIADGYQSELSPDQIEAHIATCADCRTELEEQQALSRLLDGQKRRQQTVDVWQQVEQRLPEASPTPKAAPARYTLMTLGVLLLGYRIAEMIPDYQVGLLIKFIPILLVIAAFSYLRENPFTINTELSFEGE